MGLLAIILVWYVVFALIEWLFALVWLFAALPIVAIVLLAKAAVWIAKLLSA
jgi:hypothetical protein